MDPTFAGKQRLGRGRFFVVFGYVWLTLGVFAGTVALLVLRPPLLNLLHDAGAGELAEARAVFTLVLAAMFGSVVFARRVARRLSRSSSVRARQTGLGLLALSAALCLWAWSRPNTVSAGAATHTAAHHPPEPLPTVEIGN